MTDSHDELYRAFQQYFKYNQIWLTRGTKRSGMDTRYWLSEIRRICSQRRVEIQDWRHEKDKAYRQSLLRDQGTETNN